MGYEANTTGGSTRRLRQPPTSNGVDEDMEEEAQHTTQQEHAEQARRGATDGATDGATSESGQYQTETMQK